MRQRLVMQDERGDAGVTPPESRMISIVAVAYGG
jgi:hypothetical protein